MRSKMLNGWWESAKAKTIWLDNDDTGGNWPQKCVVASPCRVLVTMELAPLFSLGGGQKSLGK